MPTYDLECVDCAHTFEAFRTGFLRDEDRVCPECGTAHAKQLLTAGFLTVTTRRGGEAAAVAPSGGCGSGCGCGH